jgi:hypothetical protein
MNDSRHVTQITVTLYHERTNYETRQCVIFSIILSLSHLEVKINRLCEDAGSFPKEQGNPVYSPRLSTTAPHTSAPPRKSPLWLPGAHIAAHSPVQEPERLRHDIADIRQAQQHHGNPQDGVEDCHYFSPLCLRSYVSITCKWKEAPY